MQAFEIAKEQEVLESNKSKETNDFIFANLESSDYAPNATQDSNIEQRIQKKFAKNKQQQRL